MIFQLDNFTLHFKSAVTKSLCLTKKLMSNPQVTLRGVTPAQLSQIIILACRGRTGLTAMCAWIPVCLPMLPAQPQSSEMLRGKSFGPPHIPQGPCLSGPWGCIGTEDYHLPPQPLNCSEAMLDSGLLGLCPLFRTLCLSFLWRPSTETWL